MEPSYCLSWTVKPGGSEHANCGKTDPVHTDAHIGTVLPRGRHWTIKAVVVEVTATIASNHAKRRNRLVCETLRKQILHKWVKVHGWMTFDSQTQMPRRITNPGGAPQWRATAGRFIRSRYSSCPRSE